jgi:CheY-like chemotaxis protein
VPSNADLIVFMSGYSADLIARHGILHGDANYLQKPFTPADLISKLQLALA